MSPKNDTTARAAALVAEIDSRTFGGKFAVLLRVGARSYVWVSAARVSDPSDSVRVFYHDCLIGLLDPTITTMTLSRVRVE